MLAYTAVTTPESAFSKTSFNIGFGASNNLAVAAATDDWDAVLLLNSDAQLEADCLDKLVEVLEDAVGRGCRGPTHRVARWAPAVDLVTQGPQRQV